MAKGRRGIPSDPTKLSTGRAAATDLTCRAVRHGSRGAYEDWGCVCPEAREAIRLVWARRRVRGQSWGRGSRNRSTEIDPVAVQRATRGERLRLTAAERMTAVVHLTEAGMSAVQIADRLGIASRTVTRYRAMVRNCHTPTGYDNSAERRPDLSHPGVGWAS